MLKYLLFLFHVVSVFAAPRAVVFDFWRVMAQPKAERFMSYCCTSLDLMREDMTIKEAIQESYWTELAEKRGIVLTDAWWGEWNETLRRSIGADAQMYALVDALKEKNVVVGLLSNVSCWEGELVERYGLYQPFEPCLLSYQIGVDKPDIEVFEMLLDILGYRPDEVVFIDDLQENIDAAKQIGIDAILFTSVAQIGDELAKRGL